MTIAWVMAGVFVAFVAVVALILAWARGRVAAQRAAAEQQGSRTLYLALAAQAAADPSGRALVKLLDALETAPAECPVTVGWLRHLAGDKPPAMLVKITWDGNEWRRLMPWETFREQIRAIVEQEPATGPSARRLLADLEQAG